MVNQGLRFWISTDYRCGAASFVSDLTKSRAKGQSALTSRPNSDPAPIYLPYLDDTVIEVSFSALDRRGIVGTVNNLRRGRYVIIGR